MQITKKLLLLQSSIDNQYLIRYFNMINKKHFKLEIINYPIVEYLNLNLQYENIINYDNLIIDSLIGFAYIESLMSKYSFLHSSMMLKKKLWMVNLFDNAELIVKNHNMIRHNAKNICEMINIIPKEFYTNTLFLSSEHYDTKKLPEMIKIHNIFKKIYINQLDNLEIISNNISYILLPNKEISSNFIRLLQEKNLFIYLQDVIIITYDNEITEIVSPFFKKIICSNAKNIIDLSKSLYEHMNFSMN